LRIAAVILSAWGNPAAVPADAPPMPTPADDLADLIVRLKGLANYYIIFILHINMPKWLFIDPYFCNFN
jgi:hypothetical protein